MYVLKRDGRKEAVFFDKITARINKLAQNLSPLIEPVLISQKVCAGVYKGVTTSELDELAAQTAANLVTTHPDYGRLAARICVSNLHKNTKKVFSETITLLHDYVNPKTNKPGPLVSDETFKIVMENASELNSAIIYDRDFGYDYFGMKTLEHSYLLKIDGKIAERPQQMLMRVAVGIHKNNIELVLKTYKYMSLRYFTHASPTMFNSGTMRPQLSSCFLLAMREDSIEGIYDTLKQCAKISKNAGGIGLQVHNIRASGSYIRGTNGTSNGLVPMLRVFNNTARYVDQGGGKRKGSFAIYIEPQHSDIFEFLELRKNHGHEEDRARDLFYALQTPDLFMKRVEADQDQTLFCPDRAPGLFDCQGDEFEELYTSYEKEGRGNRTIKARTLQFTILQSQIETGTPYMLYKDACNRKSNQKNLGTIKSSNLCTEIIQYTSKDEIAVCNLASIGLPKFISEDKKSFDHQKLYEVAYHICGNLNSVIDVNYYPVEEAKNSNMRHRPIGIGVQGLADTFMLLRLPFESEQAKQLNIEIFETIYFAALTASKDLAKIDGPYESFKGSPASKGILQFDMQQNPPKLNKERQDQDNLKKEIVSSGLRNSLLIAPMPTASTSQIMGNNECFEPYTSNVYVRRVLAGEFICINHHLLRDLIDLKLWNSDLKNQLIAENGSVQNLDIPKNLKELYKTVQEISQKTLIDMAADRGAFIDQSQSFNVHVMGANYGKITSMHFYGQKKGLKTGMYYLRTKAAADAIKFTVDKQALKKSQQRKQRQEHQQEIKKVFSNGINENEKNEKILMNGHTNINNSTILNASDTQIFENGLSLNSNENLKNVEQIEKNMTTMICSLDNKDECLACGS